MSMPKWYNDKDEFYVFSTECDDTIGVDSLDLTFATKEKLVEYVRDENARLQGFYGRRIQIFKVKLEFVTDVEISEAPRED